MANQSDVPQSQIIEEQMRQTRASLACKLESLEQRVAGTIGEVSDTVENVRGTVQETLQTVRGSITDGVHTVEEFFDLERQTHEHPWLMFGGSVAAGFLSGTLLERLPVRTNGAAREVSSAPIEPRPEPIRTHAEGSRLASASGRFEHELAELKGLAIGMSLGIVRDLLVKNVPDQLRPKLDEIIDNVTVKLGGYPVRDLIHS
jgi:hypothetical protein